MSCKKTICAGSLNKQISIIDKSQTGIGCAISFLTPLKATVWAEVKTIDTMGGNSRSIIDSTNIGEMSTHKFTIRFRTDLSGDDLIKFDDRYFKIQGFKDPTEDKRYLVVYCIERGDVDNSRNFL
jgi:SPP1 family predicted phage head-tail adaptor